MFSRQINQFLDGRETELCDVLFICLRLVLFNLVVEIGFPRFFDESVQMSPAQHQALPVHRKTSFRLEISFSFPPAFELNEVRLAEKIDAENLEPAGAARVRVHDAHQLGFVVGGRFVKTEAVESDDNVFDFNASFQKSFDNGQMLNRQTLAVGHVIKAPLRYFGDVHDPDARGAEKEGIELTRIAQDIFSIEQMLVHPVGI